MRKLLATLVLLITLAGLVGTSADGFGTSGFVQTKVGPPTVFAPTNDGGPDLPEVVGLDTVGSTLSANTGTWGGSTSSKTCVWHFIGGSSLGTNCASFGPLISGQLGNRLQVDVTATNTSGSLTVTSDFVGPIETSLPLKQFMLIGTGLGSATVTISGNAVTSIVSQTSTNIQGFIPANSTNPTTSNTTVSSGTMTSVGVGALNPPGSLPVYPANFLENGHAIYPGCAVPPAVPANTATTGSPSHVWYIDSVSGTTQDSGATGHLGHPFNSVAAIFNTGVSGYSGGALMNRTIAAGDTIYIEPTSTGASVGSISGSAFYSTSTADNTVPVTSATFTWIMTDPAASSKAVLTSVSLHAMAGFIFKNLSVENNQPLAASVGSPLVGINGSTSTGFNGPSHDIIFEGLNISSWVGHSNDAWNPSSYPNSGGQANGTIDTAGPFLGPAGQENPTEFTATASSGSTQIFMNNGIPNLNGLGIYAGALPTIYVWSPGYYYQQSDPMFPVNAPQNTGIPNGTRILDVQGQTNLAYRGTITTGPPVPAAVLNDAYFATSNQHLWVGTVGPVWTDQGAAYIDITTCDPVADAATGCPSTVYVNPNGGGTNGTPFVGCDPLANGSGGCPTGTAPAWAGTTRALAGTTISTAFDDLYFTPYMVVPSAGYFSNVDWGNAYPAIQFVGAQGGNNLDPTNVNDVAGNDCDSVKNSTARDVVSIVLFQAMANSVAYNTRSKFRINDAFDVYSSAQIITANNFTSDATYQRGHPDVIQYAESFGTQLSGFNNNVAVNNEAYTHTDSTDQFPDWTQGVNTTDGAENGQYFADNIIMNSSSTSALVTGGLFSVAVQNDVILDINAPGATKMVAGNAKAANTANQPAFSVMSNNLTNAISRPLIPTFTIAGTGFGSTQGGSTVTINSLPVSVILSWSATQVQGVVPIGATGTLTGTVSVGSVSGTTSTTSTPCNADQSTVVGNIQVPQINYETGAPNFSSATFCTGTDVGNASEAGIYADMASWSLSDTRTEVGGVTSPFTEFHPVMPSAPTGAPYTIGQYALSQCIDNEVTVTTGSCTAPGILNLRPNASFSGSPTSITCAAGTGDQCNARLITNVPTTGTNGDTYVLSTNSLCGGGTTICGTQFEGYTFPAGTYTRVNAGANMSGYGASTAFNITGSGFGGSGTVTIGGVAPTGVTWTSTQITGTMGATSPNILFTLSGTGYGTGGSVSIGGVTAVLTVYNNTTITGIMPLNALFPTSGNTIICLAGGTLPSCTSGTGTFGSATLNVTLSAGTIATASETTLTSGQVPFNPAIIGAGVSLGAQAPPADHGRKPWLSPPSVGAYE